jgi:hypothetical protein
VSADPANPENWTAVGDNQPLSDQAIEGLARLLIDTFEAEDGDEHEDNPDP